MKKAIAKLLVVTVLFALVSCTQGNTSVDKNLLKKAGVAPYKLTENEELILICLVLMIHG